jgi:hypothetical protein
LSRRRHPSSSFGVDYSRFTFSLNAFFFGLMELCIRFLFVGSMAGVHDAGLGEKGLCFVIFFRRQNKFFFPYN